MLTNNNNVISTYLDALQQQQQAHSHDWKTKEKAYALHLKQDNIS